MKVLAYVHLRNIYGSTGAGTVARAIIEQLALQQDMQLHVLADQADHRRIIAKVGSPWSSFPYHFFPHETSTQQARWIALNAPQAEDFWPDADIVFCTGESYVPTRKARLAVTMHDAAFFEADAHQTTCKYWLQRLRWRVLYERLIRSADLFHTVSQFSADRFAHHFPAMKNRLRVVHNAVADYFFVDLPKPLELLDQAIASKSPYILLPGGLNYRKNADLVLNAWPTIIASNPDLRLLVVNHSNPSYFERAKALGDSVVLLGYVQSDLLRALYSRAEIVWFPSRYEGFGMPVLEAMASRTPVVASDSSSIPEVSGGNALLLPRDKPFEHAEAISSLLGNRPLRNEMSVKGRQWAEKFRWRDSAMQLRKFFEDTL